MKRAFGITLEIEAQLGAYSFQRGRAAPGRAWLMLTVLQGASSEPLDRSAWRWELDLARHLTVQGQGLPAHPIVLFTTEFPEPGPGTRWFPKAEIVPMASSSPIARPYAPRLREVRQSGPWNRDSTFPTRARR